MSVSIKVEGIEEVVNNLKQRTSDIQDAISGGMKELVMGGQMEAQRLVRVRTGNLMRSIRWMQLGRFLFVLFTDCFYAVYQEFGTWKMTAQPYMRPAADWMRTEFSNFADYVRRVLR